MQQARIQFVQQWRWTSRGATSNVSKPFKALPRDWWGNVSDFVQGVMPSRACPWSSNTLNLSSHRKLQLAKRHSQPRMLGFEFSFGSCFGSEGLAPETTRLRRVGNSFGAARKAREPFGHPKGYWRGWCISFQVRHRLLYNKKGGRPKGEGAIRTCQVILERQAPPTLVQDKKRAIWELEGQGQGNQS